MGRHFSIEEAGIDVEVASDTSLREGLMKPTALAGATKRVTSRCPRCGTQTRRYESAMRLVVRQVGSDTPDEPRIPK